MFFVQVHPRYFTNLIYRLFKDIKTRPHPERNHEPCIYSVFKDIVKLDHIQRETSFNYILIIFQFHFFGIKMFDITLKNKANFHLGKNYDTMSFIDNI